MSARSEARHAVAAALGIATGQQSLCACCGDSPFPRAVRAEVKLGHGFADFGLLCAPNAPDLCAGCVAILAGAPPHTLRMYSIAVIESQLRRLSFDEMWSILTAPPAGIRVLSWATSGQRHHVLHAETSSPALLRIGSDAGTISVIPERDAGLVTALLALRSGRRKDKAIFTRGEILSGDYRAHSIAAFGAQEWAQHESTISQRRGDPALALYVAHCPVTPPLTFTTDDMIDDTDQTAIKLLSALAQSSTMRATDGLVFWGTTFRRRVQRHSARDLPVFVSRMMSDIGVEPHTPGAQLAVQIASLPEPEAIAVSERLRTRPEILIALSYERIQQDKQNRKATAKEKATP